MTERRRKPFDVLVAVVGIVAALWVSYWYVANQLSFAAMRYAMARIGGAECTSLTSAGFPLRLAVGCNGLRVKTSGAEDSVAVGGLSATAPLYWPLSLSASLTAPLAFEREDAGKLTMTWKTASTSASAGLRGLSQFSAFAQALSLAGPVDLPHLNVSGVTAEKAAAALAPAPGKTPDYKLTFEVRGVRLEATDKRDLPVVSLDGTASLIDVGPSLGLDPRRALRAWAGRGGKLRVENLSLAAGPVAAGGAGDLTLSPDGVLAGKILVRFTKLEELPAVVEALLPGSRTAVAVAKLLLAVTRKVDTEAGPAREATLNLGGGFISVGIVPIAAIPPIRF